MNTLNSRTALADEFHRLVAKLDVHDYFKSFHTQPQHDGSPHIEMRNDKFEFVVTERGCELERIKDLSADDVLYLLMESATRHMALQYELEVRREGTDGRSVWFPYQEKLMSDFNPLWGARLAARHARILQEHPYGS